MSFSIIKIPFSPSKYALYFYFFSSVLLFAFLLQYFLILLKTTFAIFEWFVCFSTSPIFLLQFNYMLFFIVMFHCFNATFSHVSFVTSKTILHIHTLKKMFFLWHKMLNNFWLFFPLLFVSSLHITSYATYPQPICYFFKSLNLHYSISYFSLTFLTFSFIF